MPFELLELYRCILCVATLTSIIGGTLLSHYLLSLYA